MMNFRQKFEQFMRGRYGTDKFSRVLIYASLILMLFNSFIHTLALYLLQLFLLGYAFFRMFSRNINKRCQENQKFEVFWQKLCSFIRLQIYKWKDRKAYVYTRCPGCRANLRLPRRKGKHTVKCPRCSKSFDFKCR